MKTKEIDGKETYIAHGDESLVGFIALGEGPRNGLVVYGLSVLGWLANIIDQRTD